MITRLISTIPSRVILILLLNTMAVVTSMAGVRWAFADTLDGFGTVVTTANRYENKILHTGASVSSQKIGLIQSLPVNTLSNFLNYVPGVYAFSTDGMGLFPLAGIRGFSGNGQTDFVTLLIDGMPVNDLENGLASWNMLPLFSLHSIEVLRGGSSALYGDGTMGGVVNLITEKPEKNFTNLAVGYGSYNSFNLGLNHGGKFRTGFYDLYVNNDATEGFRDHSSWNSLTFGGKVKLLVGGDASFILSAAGQLLNYETPGPLSYKQTTTDRQQSSAHFRDDFTEYSKFLVDVGFQQKINRNSDLNISLNYQIKNSEAATTYLQPPLILDMFSFKPVGEYDTTFYGNTKNRELATAQTNLSARLQTYDPASGLKMIGGLEANYGGFDNTVFDVFQGFENDYQNNYQPEEKFEFAGIGFRFRAAAYLNGEVPLFDELKLVAGLRYDLISDSFDSDFPVADTSLDKTYNAVSPKIAINLSTGETNNYKGSIYAGFGQAFKAPTIDQRTDLKSLSTAVFFQTGPTHQMEIIKGNPYSNSSLKPQRSNNFELGTYQYYRFSEKFAVAVNFAGYLIEVKDEIAFDPNDFKYANVGSVSHTGLETVIDLHFFDFWSGFINLNSANVKHTSGENEGKQPIAIPSLTHAVGVSYSPAKGFGGSLSFNGASGMYLDVENANKLDAYTIFSSRLTYRLSFVSVYADVENIFNKSYNSSGYMNYEIKYLYPAMGIFFRGGLVFEI